MDPSFLASKAMSRRTEMLAAARTGNADAQFTLACDYDFELPKDRKRASYWYRRAAEQGLAEAQNFLGESLREVSEEEAIAWLQAMIDSAK